MHEAVLEDVFGDGGGAIDLCGEGHELGLHVGGEAGELLGGDAGGFERAARADADVVVADIEADAAGLELGDERAEVCGVAAIDVEIAAGDGPGDEECAGFDAVGVDAVTRAMQFGDAVDVDGGGSRAFNFCAHGVEQGGEVTDFGLAGAVLEEGVAVGEGCGHEEVFGTGDGNLVEDDVRSVEAGVAVLARGLRGSRGPG